MPAEKSCPAVRIPASGNLLLAAPGSSPADLAAFPLGFDLRPLWGPSDVANALVARTSRREVLLWLLHGPVIMNF
jgi:hypothetical protein